MLGNLFATRTFLDREVEQWHLDVWGTLIDRFSDGLSLADTPVALPTRDFFPPTEAKGHAKAEHVFACVKAIMQMEDWPCLLEAQPRRTTGQQMSECPYRRKRGAKRDLSGGSERRCDHHLCAGPVG